MKILCFIAAIWVALLSAIPCCQGDDCKETAAAKTSAQKQNDKDCTGCSPFFRCGTCLAFTPQTQTCTVEKQVIKTALQSAVYRICYAGFIHHNIWQPPKNELIKHI